MASRSVSSQALATTESLLSMEDKIPRRNVFVKDDEVEVGKSPDDAGGETVGGGTDDKDIGGDLEGGKATGGDLEEILKHK